MARFPDLPNELVREVMTYVMPEDIENFSLISKRFYVVALPLLKEHRELRVRYSDFDDIGKAAFFGCRFEFDYLDYLIRTNCTLGDSFSKMLIDVLANRRMALYIKELRLDGWSLEWESMIPDPSHERHEHRPYTQEQFVLFKQALSRYVLPGKLETWIEELESGHEGPIIRLLLILLPRIKSIKFQWWSDVVHQLREVIERIRTDCIEDTPILTCLEQINFQFEEYFINPELRPLDLLAFLATIPSLKSLYGVYITAYGHSHDFSCLLPHSSNITDLGFKWCYISLEQLGEFLHGLKALQTFSYSHDKHDEGRGDEVWWDPAGICKVLSAHAQRSLNVLGLRSVNEPKGPIENLQDFKLLTELTLSFPLFWRGTGYSMETFACELPESIQKLSIRDIEVEHISQIESTIQELVLFRPDRLPKLEQVCYCVSWDVHWPHWFSQNTAKLRKSCEEAGFELRFRSEE